MLFMTSPRAGVPHARNGYLTTRNRHRRRAMGSQPPWF